MKVINLSYGTTTYTCNAYLLLGSYNRLEDINTLIDVGRDPIIIKNIMTINTGVGKKKVQQALLTHSHYDHISLLEKTKEQFNLQAYAFSPHTENIDHKIHEGQKIKVADSEAQVIHTPGHSHDSVCFYFQKEKILFCGDTSYPPFTHKKPEDPQGLKNLERLSRLDIDIVYPGHGPPIDLKKN